MVWLAAGGLCLFLGAGAAGCKKPVQTTVAPGVAATAFDSASPELKEAWGTVLTAAKSDDYATALLTIGQMRKQADLTLAQTNALINEFVFVHNRMEEAMKNGDTNAFDAARRIHAATRPHGP